MAHLNPALLAKVAGKTGKSVKYVREQISKRAGRLGISSEAALILWAKEYKLGTSLYQRQQSAHVQEQVRSGLTMLPPVPVAKKNGKPAKTKGTAVSPMRWAIDYLLSDAELKRRCKDLLLARGDYDRVIREATTVLDHRLKKLGKIKGHMNPDALVSKVLNKNNPILVISEHDNEQDGFHNIARGLMQAFRNPSHHSLNDKLTQQDALRFCGFVDALLGLLEQAHVNQPDVPATT
jgi:uncharacterized protein (TIGR02391 family)